jgi:hypothetical protein
MMLRINLRFDDKNSNTLLTELRRIFIRLPEIRRPAAHFSWAYSCFGIPF